MDAAAAAKGAVNYSAKMAAAPGVQAAERDPAVEGPAVVGPEVEAAEDFARTRTAWPSNCQSRSFQLLRSLRQFRFRRQTLFASRAMMFQSPAITMNASAEISAAR